MTNINKKNNGVLVYDAFNEILNTGTMLKNAARQFFRNRPTTEVQFNVLMLLKHSSCPMTQKELSECLLVDKSNLTGLVDRMESSGHLRRVKCEKDRRSYHLQLTPEAELLLEELERPYRELLGSMLGDFSDEELVLLIRMMNKLQKALDNRCVCPAVNLCREDI